MNRYKILSKLYDLLNTGSYSDYMEAADNLNPNSPLRDVIYHMAQIKKIESRRTSRKSIDRIRQESSYDHDESIPLNILNGLASRSRSNQDLADFFNTFKIGVRFRAKDGREAMIAKFTRAIQQAPPDIIKRIRKELDHYANSSETSNWFKAIGRHSR